MGCDAKISGGRLDTRLHTREPREGLLGTLTILGSGMSLLRRQLGRDSFQISCLLFSRLVKGFPLFCVIRQRFHNTRY